ncbi:MAG: leucyl aminopeptidase, partial [Alphaproteobacteria bacterium]
MTLDISFSKAPHKNTDVVVVCFYKDKFPSPPVASLNYEAKGYIDHVLDQTRRFTGKFGQVELLMLPEGAPYGYAVLLGCGEKAELDQSKTETLGGKLAAELDGKNITSAEFFIDNDLSGAGEIAASIAVGMQMRSYSFEQYKSKKPAKEGELEEEKLSSVHFVVFDSAIAGAVYEEQAHVLEGVFFARDLVNEPPNQLYPAVYAKRIADKLKPLGVEVDILDEKKMKKLGMGALLAVGQGSDHAPRLVVMRWRGQKIVDHAPLAFVGKGVTFDTGGISLKPGAGMEDMKMDMGGSAAVVGLMAALAGRKAKVNVIGVVGLVENMPSARAYRPADILTSYSGKTIEVLNTDAEVRLVLADALAYVQDVYKPRLIIDLATLTGAIIVALGHQYCGTFASDD